ncbi:hypothetical protein AKJ16_DCAP08888 [Drosera capensis]
MIIESLVQSSLGDQSSQVKRLREQIFVDNSLFLEGHFSTSVSHHLVSNAGIPLTPVSVAILVCTQCDLVYALQCWSSSPSSVLCREAFRAGGTAHSYQSPHELMRFSPSPPESQRGIDVGRLHETSAAALQMVSPPFCKHSRWSEGFKSMSESLEFRENISLDNL